MFGLDGTGLYNQNTLYYLSSNAILLVILVIAATPLSKIIYQKLRDSKWNQMVELVIIPVVTVIILCLSTAYLVDSSYNPFLYFRF